jgi:hypothetical protein
MARFCNSGSRKDCKMRSCFTAELKTEWRTVETSLKVVSTFVENLNFLRGVGCFAENGNPVKY